MSSVKKRDFNHLHLPACINQQAGYFGRFRVVCINSFNYRLPILFESGQY